MYALKEQHKTCFASIPIDNAIAWLEKQGEKANPYSGVSFDYNGHTWGMCARDNGVDISLDGQLFKHLDEQCGQKPINKVEPKFKVGDKVLWKYDRSDVKTIARVSDCGTYWIEGQGCGSGWWAEHELEPYNMSVKDMAHQIAWETSKHYDPNACKQEWCEMAALDMASRIEKQGLIAKGWRKNDKDSKPPVKNSVLMLTTHGVAEGEWLGDEWCQYRWSCKIKDEDVLYWMHLSDLEGIEKQGETFTKQDVD
jgi:hypothetical protein